MGAAKGLKTGRWEETRGKRKLPTIRPGRGRTSVNGGAKVGATALPAHWCQTSPRSISSPVENWKGATPGITQPT